MKRWWVGLVWAGCTGSSTPAEPAETVHWTVIEGSKGADRAISRAASDEGQPVVFVGATWCGTCKAYKNAVTDARMVEAHRGVHIIEVDAERHVKVLGELGIQPAGVPHWEVLDHEGKTIGRHIDGSAWTLNTVESMAEALGRFFSETGEP